MHVRNYDEAVKEIFPRLYEYLDEQNIDLSGSHFRCIHPDHDDQNPSMSIHTDPNVHFFKCWSCGASGGIFEAAHLLEGKPIIGAEFLTDNLAYLASKYDVELNYEPPTEEELYEINTYAAYRAAAGFVTNGKQSAQSSRAIADRGWTEQSCRDFGIGGVEDYSSFHRGLRGLGFSAQFIDEVDLGREQIFGSDRLIFTIQDDRGRPVGFSARNLGWTEDKKNGSKYVNQRSTGIKCNIYRKGERLFGLAQLLKRRGKKSTPVYLFEGYPDVVTAAQHGIWNSVAIGGTALTAEQVNLLKAYNIYDVILCLDGDEAGQKTTAHLLDTVLGGHKDLSVKIIILPIGTDPDEFIREHGVEKFKSLHMRTAFEWRLERFEENTDGDDIAKAMIPLIVNEGNHIVQERMCKALAKTTGISLKAVQMELERQQSIKENAISRDRQTVIDTLLQKLKRDPGQAETALREADISLYDLAKRYETDAFSEDSCLGIIMAQKEHEEGKDGSYSGFKLGDDLYDLEKELCGEWRKDVWFCFGGKPNSGKTSFMCKLSYAISSIKDNDACVIYHTIDDTTEQVIPKFVAIANGSRRLTLNQISDPNYHIKDRPDANILEKREDGYQALSSLVRDGRLIIKDANDGASLAYADRLIKYFKDKYPGRNIVYILDNFHKLQDFQTAGGDERTRFKTLSTKVKDLATRHHICLMTTVEYKKIEAGKQATNADIIETGQIEYDANLIAHVHNDLHEKGDAATRVHYADCGDGQEKLPTIEIKIGKNKVTSFKNSFFFDFFPSCSDFLTVSPGVVISRQQQEKKKLSEDLEEYKAILDSCIADAKERGHKPGKVYYSFIDRTGIDKDELRAMGLTEEEVEGYEQFFCEHYFTEIRPWQLCMNMNVKNVKQNRSNGTS
jgi:DNA primase